MLPYKPDMLIAPCWSTTRLAFCNVSLSMLLPFYDSFDSVFVSVPVVVIVVVVVVGDQILARYMLTLCLQHTPTFGTSSFVSV